MKLPFLNRNRYIVLKCYTWHKGVFERAPIKVGGPACPAADGPASYFDLRTNFSACWSRLRGMKKSATVSAPSSFRIETDGDKGLQFGAADESVVGVDYEHDFDTAYGVDKDTVITKIITPWHLEEATGVDFVLARHMQNKTMMNILSGVTNFKATCQVNIFNVISKYPHRYEVPFQAPMVSLYPMSDLPLHVECFYSPEMYTQAEQRVYNPHYRAGGVKNTKL